jgi:hypothetical protein
VTTTTTTTLGAAALAEAAIRLLPEADVTEGDDGENCLDLTPAGLALFQSFTQCHGEENANLLSRFTVRQIKQEAVA